MKCIKVSRIEIYVKAIYMARTDITTLMYRLDRILKISKTARKEDINTSQHLRRDVLTRYLLSSSTAFFSISRMPGIAEITRFQFGMSGGPRGFSR